MSSVYSNYVKRMRMCANENCKGCTYQYEGLTNTEECKEDLLYDAAEQLEDADKCNAKLVKKCKEMEKRIAELEDDLLNGAINNPERFKIYGYRLRDLILFADICKRNDVREADLKQAAWNLELAVRAWENERAEIVKNAMDEIAMRFTPDFEKAYEEMRGEHDEQADC